MKIISNFKDFYDYSPNILGFQPDEAHIYYRKNLSELKNGIYYRFIENAHRECKPIVQTTLKNLKYLEPSFDVPFLQNIYNELHHKYDITKEHMYNVFGLCICGKMCILLLQRRHPDCISGYRR